MFASSWSMRVVGITDFVPKTWAAIADGPEFSEATAQNGYCGFDVPVGFDGMGALAPCCCTEGSAPVAGWA